jgi:hypothetical protein
VIIGGGALGSILAELLVRGGVHNLLVLDEEVLEMGNLVRHTLAMNDIGRGKAQALAARLNDLSPNANVGGIGKSLQDLDGPDQIEVLAADMVWDCTGNDDVLHQLEQCSWSSKPIICSLSLSFGARRLFMYVQRSPFSAEAFLTELNPWLLMDLEHAEEPLPREGIGCWHPVFPAAAVDVHLMVALALKSFVGRDKQLSEPNFIVFEQVLNNGQVTGVRQVGT